MSIPILLYCVYMFKSSVVEWSLQYSNNYCEMDTVQITIEQRVLLYRVAYQYITIIIIMRLTIGGPDDYRSSI